ncbi:MAG: XTP/dITP diphosphatase [Pyrinomonadaceae bacterium]|nr:XTP/dITP diphosphatase [Pyrinomonadaceae bacterium]
MKTELLIATKNAGKVKEFRQLLSDFPVVLHSADEFEEIPEPEETGETFADNAILKARYYAEKTGLISLADDSGLAVDALNGAPGVFSARYAGANATNAERIAKLLKELSEMPIENRSARFICSMAISEKDGKILHLVEGICEGKIAFQPTGTNGFGYDPIFIPKEFSQSFGELSDEIKHKISHRGQAIAKIIKFLHDFAVS